MYLPKFTISNKILKNIGIIEACKEVIDHAPLLPYYEKKFQTEALVRSVHHGTHIEGNELSLSQAEKVVMGQQIIARERDIQEVINYREVMEEIEKIPTSLKLRGASKFPTDASIETKAMAGKQITEELLLDLHKLTVNKILPPETAGVYRKTQVVVRNSHTGDVSFRPPEAIAVPYQIHDFIEFANAESDMHTVLKSGIMHYEFVRIHPFLDGNGRVARALSTLILFQQGYDIRRFFSLEEYFDSDASRYYEALQSVANANGELTPWLEYFTEGLAIELTKIKEKVESVSVDGKIRERLGGKPLMLSERQLTIIEYIQKTGYLENKGFKQVFPMISEDTVLNELKVLIKEGIIKKQGSTKASKYVMAQ